MKFLLDKPKSDKDTFILLIGTLPEGRFIYSTKHKVHPDHWEGQRCKRVKGKNYDDTNELLNHIDNLIRELKRLGQLTKERLTEELDLLTGRRKRISGIWNIIDEIIADREFGRELNKGEIFSPETIKGYKHSKDKLFEFNENLSFDFTEGMYNKMLEHFTKQDLSINGLGKHVKNWRMFFNAARDRGYHKNSVQKWFKVPEEQTEDVYLSETELQKIATHKLHRSCQQIARDWYIVGSYTGLRISDLTTLTDERNIHGDFITIANEKTNAKVVLPIHPLVKAVIKKWKGFPPKVSDQELNRQIKEVAQLAGLNQKFLYTITKGGKRVDEYIPKWQMVSNHTMRRSFITNLLRNNFPDNLVMDLAGIKKHATLLKYKKSTPEETAKDASNYPFFSGKQGSNPAKKGKNSKKK